MDQPEPEPPKPVAKRSKNPWMYVKKQDRGFVTMIVGGIALVLYATLAIVSGVYLVYTKLEIAAQRQLDDILDACKTNPPNKVVINRKLQHTVGLTIRVIFWTWLLVIYLITFLVYIVYVVAGFTRSYSFGRAYFFVIGIITILNFVPCTYMFSFGEVTSTELVTYWAMFGVILLFRIIDIVFMCRLVKEIKKQKESQGMLTNPQSVVVIQSGPETLPTGRLSKVSPAPLSPPEIVPEEERRKRSSNSSNPPGIVPEEERRKRSSDRTGNPFEENSPQ